MIVTAIEQTSKNKYRIYVEEEFAFVLYKGELSRFHIHEGGEISESVYKEIRTEVILKRAKKKAMYLLNISDRTERELQEKLEREEFPDWAVQQAVSYVKSFGYINDERYIENFIRSKKEKESRKSIYAKLCRKGLDGEKIQDLMELYFEETTENETISNLLRKKGFCRDTADAKEKQKMAAYLARKGFSYSAIRESVGWE